MHLGWSVWGALRSLDAARRRTSPSVIRAGSHIAIVDRRRRLRRPRPHPALVGWGALRRLDAARRRTSPSVIRAGFRLAIVDRRRRRRRPHPALVGPVVAGVIVATIVFSVPGSPGQSVTLNGRRLSLPPRATVQGVLRSAHLSPRAGSVYSVATHRLLSAQRAQLQVRVDGRPATLATTLRSGDVVQVEGASGLEPMTTTYRFDTTPGLPDVERALWHPGRSALEQEAVGSLSGEVQSRSIVGPPVPGQPVTDKVVALTFDDGPDPRWTPAVLKILADEGVPATFCLVGIHVQAYPELVKAELAQHETLCDHTLDHDVHLDRAPRDRVAHEVNAGADAIAAATGAQVSFYRPPGGTLSPAVIDTAHQRGLRVLYWTLDPVDYLRPPPEVLLQRIVAGVRPGAIILLHDGFGNDRSHTVAILRPLIDTLRAQGYSFTTPDAVRPADTPPDQAQRATASTGLVAAATP